MKKRIERTAKRKLEVGDQIEEFGVWRAKDEPGVRVRQGYRKAEVLAVVDEPAEYGTERVALIRHFDGDDITGWSALADVAWQNGPYRFEPEFEKRQSKKAEDA